MQEFWFCDKCGSMNRADSERCYKCRAPQAGTTAGTTTVLRQGYVTAPGLDKENLEIARAHMSNGRYVSAWQLGYLTGFMTIMAVAVEALYVAVALLRASSRSPGYSPDAFPWFETPPVVLGLAIVALVVVVLVLQGLFLSLTSLNSPALGSGTSRFGPIRCAAWPLESVLWAVWGLALGLRSYDRWWARRLDFADPLSSATDNPPRLLEDLLDRLWVPGRSGSGLVSLWGTAWGALVLIGYLLLFTLVLALIGTPLPFLVLLALESCVFALCFITLARIIFEMAQRQHIREQWVLGDLRPATVDPSAGAQGGGETPRQSSPMAPQPAPAQPSTFVPESGPVASPSGRSKPIAVYSPPGEEIQWSRPIERVSSRQGSEELDELPPAWQRAVEATAPAMPQVRQPGLEEQPLELSDRQLIRPSSSTISRYRAPFAEAEPRPAADPTNPTDHH